jgi:hypothetical protein
MGMKYILIFLLVPFSHAWANNCTKLSQIAQFHDRELQFQSIKVKDSTNGICDDKANIIQVQKLEENLSDQAIEPYACHSLAAVEERIANLENEQGLLLGFDKLKSDIKANKQQAGELKGNDAQTAGLNFIDGLNAAETLEQLLENADGNMLVALRNKNPDERKTVDEVKKIDRSFL